MYISLILKLPAFTLALLFLSNVDAGHFYTVLWGSDLAAPAIPLNSEESIKLLSVIHQKNIEEWLKILC